MKLLTFFSIILFSMVSIVTAQIPNADFENWTEGSPDGWWTDNVYPTIMPVTQTTDKESGASALKGEVVSFNGIPVAPMLATGAIDTSIGTFGGFAINKRYSSVNGYYKFTPMSDDSMLIVVAMTKNGNVIGGGALKPDPASGYTQFNADIHYTTEDTPDTCRIMFSIFNHAGTFGAHTGSVMYIDNLSFGNVTAVNNDVSEPNSFKLLQNYPNPFNPTTNIKYNLSSSGFVRLTIYNVLGQKVKTLVNKIQNAGENEVTADLSLFTSGVYFYRLNVRSKNGMHFSSIKKMVLMK